MLETGRRHLPHFEVIPLYAEIYARLARDGDLPHGEAVAARAAGFADACS
jgi:hypothetical protein